MQTDSFEHYSVCQIAGWNALDGQMFHFESDLVPLGMVRVVENLAGFFF